MLSLNVDHPKFSLPMEVLTMIPRMPGWASMRTMVEDLGLDGQKELRTLLKSLGTDGYDVFIHTKPGKGRVVSVPKVASAWGKVRQASEKYLKEVYRQ